MYLSNYYLNVIRLDLLTKLILQKTKNIFNIEYITVAVTLNQNELGIFSMKDVIKSVLILELITGQKASIYNITNQSKNKTKLIGFKCKVSLRKINIFKLLNMLLILKRKRLLILTKDDLSANKEGNYFLVLKNILNLNKIPLSLFFRWKIPLKIYFKFKKLPSTLNTLFLYNLYNIYKYN